MAQSLEDGADKSIQVNEAITSTWRKSTRSIANGQCVEAARLTDDHLALRDSIDKSGPMIVFTRMEWRAFLNGIKSGGFDSLQGRPPR
jgi:hypothetical protein